MYMYANIYMYVGYIHTGKQRYQCLLERDNCIIKSRSDHILLRLFLSLRYADSQTTIARNIAVGDNNIVKLMYDDVPLTDKNILFWKNKTSYV